MSPIRSALDFIHEVFASAWSQRAASALTIVIVAAMCAATLLTTGRSVGAQEAVLSSIDSVGTRTIVIRAEPSAGLTSTVLERARHIEGISWMSGFGPAFDTFNSRISDGVRVGARKAYGPAAAAMTGSAALPGAAFATASALEKLGMSDPSGGLSSPDGLDLAVVGKLELPEQLRFLEPLVLVADAGQSEGPLAVLVVVVSEPHLVSPVARSLESVLGADDASKLSVSTSERLADLRALVDNQLGAFGRELVLLILGVSAALVGAVQYGLVLFRRKDFGRRRALGASRQFVFSLLLVQTALLCTLGSVIGCSVALAGLAASGDPLPEFSFFAAVAILAVSSGLLAAVVPAVAAASRDPLRELRVP
jgi:putative ABC transport system permease protein